MRHIITLDVETQHTADEVGGWSNIRDMRLAVAVTYDAADDVYRDYAEQDAKLLIAALRSADMVVGYNVLRFDYEVLRGYTDDPLSDIRTVDMLQDLYQVMGWRPKLDNVAAATLGESKSADGLQAVRWFREGKLDKVIAYCRRDVEVTWNIYEFGRSNGYVKYRDKRWREHMAPVQW
ncbi:MAG: ribonuclease H-like domain-containing protein [Anaerolineae bacterium]|jgi:DEAD/DEAH box helicase domain-containing protein|nr:ribonuclease H-like domain-containing protein [Anaerolineae bacterium]